MKDITFEELALELSSARFWDNGDDFVKSAVNLMQQVREATIAEVSLIAKEDFGIGSGRPFIKHIKSLPTDRIKTEK